MINFDRFAFKWWLLFGANQLRKELSGSLISVSLWSTSNWTLDSLYLNENSYASMMIIRLSTSTWKKVKIEERKNYSHVHWYLSIYMKHISLIIKSYLMRGWIDLNISYINSFSTELNYMCFATSIQWHDQNEPSVALDDK